MSIIRVANGYSQKNKNKEGFHIYFVLMMKNKRNEI